MTSLADDVRIVVLGGGGKLGQELKRQRPDDVVALTRKDCDILSRPHVLRRVLRDVDPEVVVHAAGITDLARVEQEHELAWRVHVEGTMNVAMACAQLHLPVIYCSTDYVFSGHRTVSVFNSYRETSFPDPLSYYGMTKLVSETIIRSMVPEHVVVRGTMKDEGWKHRKAPTDMWQSLMLRRDYASCLLRFADKLAEGMVDGIYHIGGERVSVFDWARRYRPDVVACLRSDIDTIRLPADVSLDTRKASDLIGPMPVYGPD